jgi:hypothetical protein
VIRDTIEYQSYVRNNAPEQIEEENVDQGEEHSIHPTLSTSIHNGKRCIILGQARITKSRKQFHFFITRVKYERWNIRYSHLISTPLPSLPFFASNSNFARLSVK